MQERLQNQRRET